MRMMVVGRAQAAAHHGEINSEHQSIRLIAAIATAIRISVHSIKRLKQTNNLVSQSIQFTNFDIAKTHRVSVILEQNMTFGDLAKFFVFFVFAVVQQIAEHL